MEEDKSSFKFLICKPTGKRLGRPRREEKVRMDLKEIVVDMKNWVDLEQDRDY